MARTPLQGTDALRAQAAALRAHVEDSALPSRGPGGPAEICVGFATVAADLGGDLIEPTSDGPEPLIKALRASRANLRRQSECDPERGDKDIRLAVGWPIEVGDEIEVPIDRHCGWICAGGYKVRLRRQADHLEFVAQITDRWAS